MDDFAKALEQHNYEFQKGQVVRGKVFEYDSNGAYVDIGGKSSAFLPIEEAALRTVTDLSEVVPLDEERDFLIIREQDADGQVTLSLRQLRRYGSSRLVEAGEAAISSATSTSLESGRWSDGLSGKIFLLTTDN